MYVTFYTTCTCNHSINIHVIVVILPVVLSSSVTIDINKGGFVTSLNSYSSNEESVGAETKSRQH